MIKLCVGGKSCYVWCSHSISSISIFQKKTFSSHFSIQLVIELWCYILLLSGIINSIRFKVVAKLYYAQRSISISRYFNEHETIDQKIGSRKGIFSLNLFIVRVCIVSFIKCPRHSCSIVCQLRCNRLEIIEGKKEGTTQPAKEEWVKRRDRTVADKQAIVLECFSFCFFQKAFKFVKFYKQTEPQTKY